MKKWNWIMSLVMAAFLMLSGCAGKVAETVQCTAYTSFAEKNGTEKESGTAKENGTAEGSSTPEAANAAKEVSAVEAANLAEETNAATPGIEQEAENMANQPSKLLQTQAKQAGETVTYVGIAAHVKEKDEGSFVISSDTDDFPGAFMVIGTQEMVEMEGLKGGDSIFILMEDLHEKDEQGLSLYRAKRILPMPENKNTIEPDVILTSAPEFSLVDTLSSAYSPLKIQSGNYSWTVEEHGETRSIVACGNAPLEAAKMNVNASVKLPRYNQLDNSIYSFSTEKAPDILIVRQWDVSQIDAADEKEQSITIFYDKNPFLELEAGKVYEFTAEWKEENLQKNKFCGTASYVFVTE